jgi:hypothetical protein
MVGRPSLALALRVERVALQNHGPVADGREWGQLVSVVKPASNRQQQNKILGTKD